LSDDDLINLLQSSPVAISISSNRWEQYSSGVFSCRSSAAVGHAVLLIGYAPNYWIVKNQWGITWGKNGYIRISRNTSANCQIGTSATLCIKIY
jgi:cathepsin L